MTGNEKREEGSKVKCPYCGKTAAYKHECDEGITVSINKVKPKCPGDLPHLLISIKCGRSSCKQIYWTEVCVLP